MKIPATSDFASWFASLNCCFSFQIHNWCFSCSFFYEIFRHNSIHWECSNFLHLHNQSTIGCSSSRMIPKIFICRIFCSRPPTSSYEIWNCQSEPIPQVAHFYANNFGIRHLRIFIFFMYSILIVSVTWGNNLTIHYTIKLSKEVLNSGNLASINRRPWAKTLAQ